MCTSSECFRFSLQIGRMRSRLQPNWRLLSGSKRTQLLNHLRNKKSTQINTVIKEIIFFGWASYFFIRLSSFFISRSRGQQRDSEEKLKKHHKKGMMTGLPGTERVCCKYDSWKFEKQVLFFYCFFFLSHVYLRIHFFERNVLNWFFGDFR